ncbi:retrotransposon nucleocapsid protein [Curvularia clavata]|uniref:Retrotransposon nucleocapsid protein n=1 Tax=Curvularia clavata TaxID=95742 RepID=A0A9Q9DQL7_CURCL|nr:retrotransposon nucleocapsid protein [Curvularia clavata]
MVSYLRPSSRRDPSLLLLPPQYEDFADLASEEDAKCLAKHSPHNLVITLKEGTTPPHQPLYRLSKSELALLQNYLLFSNTEEEHERHNTAAKQHKDQRHAALAQKADSETDEYTSDSYSSEEDDVAKPSPQRLKQGHSSPTIPKTAQEKAAALK